MIIDFRFPLGVAIIMFFLIALFKNEDNAFLAGYFMSLIVFTISAIFAKSKR